MESGHGTRFLHELGECSAHAGTESMSDDGGSNSGHPFDGVDAGSIVPYLGAAHAINRDFSPSLAKANLTASGREDERLMGGKAWK
jgi:hypothetical protein